VQNLDNNSSSVSIFSAKTLNCGCRFAQRTHRVISVLHHRCNNACVHHMPDCYDRFQGVCRDLCATAVSRCKQTNWVDLTTTHVKDLLYHQKFVRLLRFSSILSIAKTYVSMNCGSGHGGEVPATGIRVPPSTKNSISRSCLILARPPDTLPLQQNNVHHRERRVVHLEVIRGSRKVVLNPSLSSWLPR